MSTGSSPHVGADVVPLVPLDVLAPEEPELEDVDAPDELDEPLDALVPPVDEPPSDPPLHAATGTSATSSHPTDVATKPERCERSERSVMIPIVSRALAG